MAPCPGDPSGRLSPHTNDSLRFDTLPEENLSRDLRGLVPRRAPVIVLHPDNVIFPEVVTVLDLDKYERDVADVLNPVRSAERDIDGISSPHIDAVAVKGDHTLSANHEPMLGTA
jgi:hypothetical protein